MRSVGAAGVPQPLRSGLFCDKLYEGAQAVPEWGDGLEYGRRLSANCGPGIIAQGVEVEHKPRIGTHDWVGPTVWSSCNSPPEGKLSFCTASGSACCSTNESTSGSVVDCWRQWESAVLSLTCKGPRCCPVCGACIVFHTADGDLGSGMCIGGGTCAQETSGAKVDDGGGGCNGCQSDGIRGSSSG